MYAPEDIALVYNYLKYWNSDKETNLKSKCLQVGR